MRRRRCSLCGGKLVNNKCVECGLDNSKSDTSYRVNESKCTHEPLTHVHHEAEKVSKVHTVEKEPAKQFQKGKHTVKIFVVIGILIFVITGFAQIAQKIQMSSWKEESVEEYDPYKYLEKTLPETGEHFEETYTGGEYIVGLHIPEGQYRVELLSGSGSVDLEDSENHVYYSEFLADAQEEGVEREIEDFRLFAGAKVDIDSQLEVRFISENAQVQGMKSGMENPLTESVEIKEDVVAGKDFPAGVYDVTFRRPDEEEYGMGYMKYIVPGTIREEDIEEYEISTGSVLLGESGEIYHNVVLPEGTTVTVEEGIIILTPSEKIESEDYGAYYADQYVE